ncbi:hypothetical protein CTEN210_00434 [Chaetoceros tenuissimus]|uniref:Uncharacterized protein n=1 Tax=Chaetoceros tenuissimus TaxID=426638 RepID=A0AAD3CF53_9STRA|nr:hypothetical protein CTEN210_00434 [Chaetoceros tenuissimus]
MNISTFQSNLDFIKSLYFREEWKDEKCRDTILEALEEANEKILDAFGESMHILHEHKPPVEAVEKVIKKFPSTLSYKGKENEDLDDEDGQFPLQKAAYYDCAAPEYVPVLAKEGMRHQVGGEDARGGLLTRIPNDPDGWNTLQCLVCFEEEKSNEAARLAAVKELRKLGLLKKNDIVEYELLYMSLIDNKGSHIVFDYLVEWDPDALISSCYEDMPLIHAAQQHYYEGPSKLLKAGFKHHPDKGGLLFVENDDGMSALDSLFAERGQDKFLEILHNILSPTKDYPILHHIFTKAPKHKEIFAKKFPWAGHLRDHNGRSLHQALLSAGPEVMNENDILFAMLTDNQIREKDPVTTLYPFAAMAVGEHADLDSCFYLLRRHPSVMDNRSRANSTFRRRRKKRKVSK